MPNQEKRAEVSSAGFILEKKKTHGERYQKITEERAHFLNLRSWAFSHQSAERGH